MGLGNKELERQIADLRAKLRDKEDEMRKLEEECDERLQKMAEKNARKCDEIRQQCKDEKNEFVENGNAQIAEIQAAYEKIEAELQELRGSNVRCHVLQGEKNDLLKSIKRLMVPITRSDVTKKFTGYKVKETVDAFKLVDSYDIAWVFYKRDMVRNSAGHLVNLFEHLEYKALFQDEFFQQAMPPGIVSAPKVYFVDRIKDTVYHFVTPESAKIIIVQCLVDQSNEFQNWCEQHQARIKVNVPRPNYPEQRLIYLLLPFPIDTSHIHIDPDLDGPDATATDIIKEKEEDVFKLRKACQKIYMQQFYAVGYNVGRLNEDSEIISHRETTEKAQDKTE